MADSLQVYDDSNQNEIWKGVNYNALYISVILDMGAYCSHAWEEYCFSKIG